MWSLEPNSLGEALAVIVVMFLYCLGLFCSRISADSQLSEAVIYYYIFPIVMSCVGAPFASRYPSLAMIAICALFMLIYMCRSRGVFEKIPQIPTYSKLAIRVMAFFPLVSCLVGAGFNPNESHFWPHAGFIIGALLLGYTIWRQLYSIEQEERSH